MAKTTFFKTCPVCGAALDPGERCDCEREKPKKNTDRIIGFKGDNIKRKAV